jgi:hypothetical protein
MSALSGINIAGTFQNMLHTGVLVTDCLSEFIDNSFDWGSTTVHIHVLSKTRQIIVADNGCGMDEATLNKSRILNECSDASNTRLDKDGLVMVQNPRLQTYRKCNKGMTR